MKKIISILLFLNLSFPWLFSQVKMEDDNNVPFKKNYIFLHPFPSFHNTLQLGYERIFIDDGKSILISGGFIAKGYNSELDMGFADELQFRFYLNNLKNMGQRNKFRYAFHFSPFFAHKYIHVRSYMAYDYSNSISAGIISGMKGTYSRFVFDIYLGGGFKKSFSNNDTPLFYSRDIREDNYTGIEPKIGLLLGFCF
jgi:hypothetical protein